MFAESGSVVAGLAGGTPHPQATSHIALLADWDSIAEPLQLRLATAALRRAAASIALQAEILAREMETGALEDRDGPEALRLLAAVVRVTAEDGLAGALPA